MGLQYSTVAANDADIPLKEKISGALDQTLYIYRVDEATRKREIDKVMNLDCRGISEQVIEAFIVFVNRMSNEALDEKKEAVRKRDQAKSKQLCERSKAI